MHVVITGGAGFIGKKLASAPWRAALSRPPRAGRRSRS